MCIWGSIWGKGRLTFAAKFKLMNNFDHLRGLILKSIEEIALFCILRLELDDVECIFFAGTYFAFEGKLLEKAKAFSGSKIFIDRLRF